MATKKSISDLVKIIFLNRTDQINGMHTNSIKFKLQGSQVNNVLVNTIRRVCKELIPIFAFDNDNIIVEESTNMVNTSTKVIYLANIPIINKSYKNKVVVNDERYLEKVIDLETKAFDKDLKKSAITIREQEEIEKKKTEEKFNNLNMVLNFTNETNQIQYYTTDDVEFYLKGERIESIYPRPLALLQLKPGETYKATCIATLNIALYSAIYESCAQCTFEHITDNEYDFYIESSRQISEEDILIRACKILIIKLDDLEKKLNTELKKDVYYEGDIIIPHANHTIGAFITRGIQDHPQIQFCGYMMDNLDINEINLKYKLKDNKKSILDIIKEVFEEQKQLLLHIISEINKFK